MQYLTSLPPWRFGKNYELGDIGNSCHAFITSWQVDPSCVAAICGRAFMKLALGDEQGCVNDVVQACGVAMSTVTAHITALPQDAKRILLHWLGEQSTS